MNTLKSNEVLNVGGLTVVHGDHEILDKIDFTLSRNEVLGIVGETGAGKSMLARALIDLLPDGVEISKGSVKFDGNEISSLSASKKRNLRGGQIALIGTNAKALLDPVQTVGNQVARVLRAHKRCSQKEADAEAIELFKKVGIVNPEARAKAYPHELSGGMAQRVVIAMAMIAHPKIVLADDATLGLDATIQVQVLDMLVAQAREQGVGVVLITHDLGIIAHYCDRVAIMRQGQIVEIGSVAEFLIKPKQAYSETLLEAAKARPVPMAESSKVVDIAGQRPLLDVRELLKLFPTANGVVRAVDGVSFSVGRNETLALVGESGSGKTTIGQCLVKLLSTTGGEVYFDGQETTSLSDNQFRPVRRRIQMVFQEPYVALNPRWSVRELISEPLGLVPEMDRTSREKRVRELLDLVGISQQLLDDYPHELTAGEQKRVGIARALSTKPDFVVFDEPTTALDIRIRAQIIDLVRDLQKELGMSALFITHDLNSVRSLAHNVAVMRHGKIVEIGETETIFESPSHEYTRKLLAAELPIEHGAAGGHSNEATPDQRKNDRW
jgi:peptide/nickel transport system ATP-binding protein